jgi:guanine nucleotide-binding protein alpha-1 subunit
MAPRHLSQPCALSPAVRHNTVHFFFATYQYSSFSVYSILEAIAPDEPFHATLLADDSGAQFADDDLLAGSLGQASIIISADGPAAACVPTGTRVAQYDTYRRQLAPLLALEDKLMRALASPDETEDDATLPNITPATAAATNGVHGGEILSSPGGGGTGPSSPSWGWGRHTTPPWEVAAQQQQQQQQQQQYHQHQGVRSNGRSSPGPRTTHALRPPVLIAPTAMAGATAPSSPLASSPSSGLSAATTGATRRSRSGEPLVAGSSRWKEAFAFGRRLRAQSPKSAHTNEIEGWWEDPEDPVHVMNASAPVMEALWRDPAVKTRLKERRLRLEESSGL